MNPLSFPRRSQGQAWSLTELWLYLPNFFVFFSCVKLCWLVRVAFPGSLLNSYVLRSLLWGVRAFAFAFSARFPSFYWLFDSLMHFLPIVSLFSWPQRIPVTRHSIFLLGGDYSLFPRVRLLQKISSLAQWVLFSYYSYPYYGFKAFDVILQTQCNQGWRS